MIITAVFAWKSRKEGEAVVTEPVMKNNTALTLGIIGLILGSIVLGILAIVFSKSQMLVIKNR